MTVSPTAKHAEVARRRTESRKSRDDFVCGALVVSWLESLREGLDEAEHVGLALAGGETVPLLPPPPFYIY